MKTYAYTAKDPTGKVIRGTMQVESHAVLLEKLQASDMICTEYHETKASDIKKGAKFKTPEVAFFCRQLSSMLTAGLTLVKALDILYKEETDKKKKQCLLEVYEDIQKGKSLSDALLSQGSTFPELLITMVAAGESSGNLDTVMVKMAEHYAKLNKTGNKVKSAMIYPAVLGGLTVVIVIALFTFVIPQLMGIFEGTELPFLTKIMLAISNFMTTKWYIYVPIIIGLIIGTKYYLGTEAGRYAFDRLKLKLPKVGSLYTTVLTGRFASTLSTMYSSGVPMIESLERSAAVLNNTYITEKFATAVDNVKMGDAISSAIAKTEIFESMFCSVIYVGEESGSLDEILAKTADYYEEEADSAIQRMVAILEPMMIIVLGIIIGLVVASILPAMYNMYESVG